jgi:hypothetical protein
VKVHWLREAWTWLAGRLGPAYTEKVRHTHKLTRKLIRDHHTHTHTAAAAAPVYNRHRRPFFFYHHHHQWPCAVCFFFGLFRFDLVANKRRRQVK